LPDRPTVGRWFLGTVAPLPSTHADSSPAAVCCTVLLAAASRGAVAAVVVRSWLGLWPLALHLLALLLLSGVWCCVRVRMWGIVSVQCMLIAYSLMCEVITHARRAHADIATMRPSKACCIAGCVLTYSCCKAQLLRTIAQLTPLCIASQVAVTLLAHGTATAVHRLAAYQLTLQLCLVQNM
jgi:hypothetical protein